MSMYSSKKNKGSFLLSGAGQSASNNYLTSPTTGNKISLTEAIIPSGSVWESVYKSKYNNRSRELMTPATVMDILPSIRESGRNVMPVIAVKDAEGKYEIISGMKRSYAVSISPDTSLVINFATEMSDEDKKVLAFTADLTDKPSFLDTALSLRDLKTELGDKFNVRDAALSNGISKSAVAEFIKFAELPTELFKLFPGAAYVTWRFLRQVTQTKKTSKEIVEAIKDIEAISTSVEKVLAEDAIDILKAEVKELEAKIIKALATKKGRPKAPKVFEPGTPLHQDNLIQGVEAKIGSKGSVSISLSKEVINSDIGMQLIKLISNQK